jgi:hypothetical protein
MDSLHPTLRDNNDLTQQEIKNSQKIMGTIPFYYLRFHPLVKVSELNPQKLVVFQKTGFIPFFDYFAKQPPAFGFKAVLESFFYLQKTVLLLKQEKLWVNLSPDKIGFNFQNQPVIHNLETLVSFGNVCELKKVYHHQNLTCLPFEGFVFQKQNPKQPILTSTQVETWSQEYADMYPCQEREPVFTACKEVLRPWINRIFEPAFLAHMDTWDTCSLCLLFLKLLSVTNLSPIYVPTMYALQEKLKAYIHPDPQMRLRDFTTLDLDFF